MSKPKKKPAVSPKKGREWLRRNEEEGESAPQIADKDGYDPRTVRKHMEVARQDRERKEARSQVLRNALERHYEDFTLFAEQLRSELASSTISTISKQDRLWSALRQHLPRSPIWKLVDRLEYLNGEIIVIEEDLKKKVQELYQDAESNKRPELKKSKLFPVEIIGAVIYHIKNFGDQEAHEFNETPPLNGEIEVGYEPYNCARVHDSELLVVKRFITDLMIQASELQESVDIKIRLAQREKVVKTIEEELATIKLRRIVPGRCKYCPI